jgi:hypothetical protein
VQAHVVIITHPQCLHVVCTVMELWSAC